MLTNKTRFALLVAAFAVTSLPIVAQAQRRSPLADAPAVRKRYELRSLRAELGAGMGTTLNQDYFHTVMFNAKGGVHLTDWLSISGFAAFAVANMETGFQGRLVESLDPQNPNPLVPREPTQAQAEAGLVKISNIFGVQGEGTFFTGKYSLFGKLFASYDFYVLAGAAFMNASSQGSGLRSCDQAPQAAGNPDRYVCGTSGMKIGANLGVGFHSYFNNWLALNVELRDVLARINYSGRDVNGDGAATADDASLTHTYMLGANLVVYLPATPSISP